MAGILTPENLFTLMMLIALQAVLGFDNLLYISIESRRVAPARQAYVRRLGIGLAIGFRLILLFVVIRAIEALKAPFFVIDLGDLFYGSFNFHALVALLGGGFILYTAIKEIFHLLSVDHLGHDENAHKRTVSSALFWIVSMNLIFSFDSILSAVALTDVFPVMALAIIIGGVLMIWLSDHVARFLEQNRAYEVLGLFVLLVVGILLLSEGGHLAHIHLFSADWVITPMSKATFYFVIFVMIGVSIVQSRYRTKLIRAREQAAMAGVPTMEPDNIHFADPVPAETDNQPE